MVAASDGSAIVSNMTFVTKDASGGVYPMEYTLNYKGTYVLNVTGLDAEVIVRLDEVIDALDWAVVLFFKEDAIVNVLSGSRGSSTKHQSRRRGVTSPHGVAAICERVATGVTQEV